MPEPAPPLIEAIRRLHGADASWVHSVPVKEVFQDQTVWEGEVQVFDLKGHPTAKRCYAWSHAVEGSEKRRFVAVLHEGGVDSPETAVRAAIVQEQRGVRKMQNVAFPQALRDLLQLPQDTSVVLLAYLNEGWNGLPLGEREKLAKRLSAEPDTLQRLGIAIAGVLPGVYRR